MGVRVEPEREVAAAQAQTAVLQTYLARLRLEHAEALAELAVLRQDNADLRLELEQSPRQRERADHLQEHLDRLRARPGVEAVERIHATLARVPGGRIVGRRMAAWLRGS